jgi:hypothetical protein
MTSKKDLEHYAREAQVAAWDHLNDALRRAINGVWSIECGGFAIEALRAARLVGPTPPDEVPSNLVGSGIYAQLLALIDIPHQVSRLRLEPDLQEKFARTMVTLTHDDREMAYIRSEALAPWQE